MAARPARADDALLDKVLADPDDDALRAVWADALIERGDPLGELISIQALARDAPLTPAQDKRARSLIAKHRASWLGKLAGIVQHREGLHFDRGLVAECQVQVKRLPLLGAAVGDPHWAALRRIWFCDRFAWDPRIVPLLVHPAMRSLREVYTIGMNNVFPLLARHTRPLPFTRVWTVDDSFRRPAASIRDIHELGALPALHTLGFTYQAEEYVLDLPVVKRVSALGLVNALPAGEWLRRTRRHEHLSKLELRRYWIPIQGPQRSHWILTFTRGTDGHWRELAIARSHAPTLEMLAEDVTSIPVAQLVRIRAPVELHAQLRRFKGAELVSA